MKRQFDSLLECVHEMVHAAPNGRPAKEVAELCGKRYTTLNNELNESLENFKLGAELLLPLMKACGSVAPLEYLAAQMGGVFVKVPAASGPLSATHQAAMQSVSAFGEMMHEYGLALENDGMIDRAEKLRIKQAIHELINRVLSLDQALEAEAQL